MIFKAAQPSEFSAANRGAGYTRREILAKSLQLLAPLCLPGLARAAQADSPKQAETALLKIDGVYPHLAVFSDAGEIGIGAVAAWARHLWFITYPPHAPKGSADKLWMLDSNFVLTARPESVGGTHANRMIHRESRQLIIGPYLIDTSGRVRVIPPTIMPGRLTATARHLSDPARRVYFFTMENGLYDVDVETLEVKTIYRDGNAPASAPPGPFPGTHGKGGCSGQGRILFADNGQARWSVQADPDYNGPAGNLAEHSGQDWSAPWQIVERKCFTEITGPGGISGALNNDDPIWALGWDKRSVILKLLDGGRWHTYRLPKASYTQDAFHGWYTEWPRIREITDGQWLMHMHGMFYWFPKIFSAASTAGIVPISTFLKMPVDYCWWNGQLVMARDEVSIMQNRFAGQSHSALWFGQLSDLAAFGPPAGWGGPCLDDAVSAGVPSDPFLIAGFQDRVLHVKHRSSRAVVFSVEVDASGTGAWKKALDISVPANGYAWALIPPALQPIWARLVADQDARAVTAYFHLGNAPALPRPSLFAGIADIDSQHSRSDGIIKPVTGNARVLQFAAGKGYYEMDDKFELTPVADISKEQALRAHYSLDKPDFTLDPASVIVTSREHRYRLPKTSARYESAFACGWPRGLREVVTERYLFNAHGTFYEVPRADSGSFRHLRPITTHRKRISDFAGWRGLLVMAGVEADGRHDGHCFRSADGQAALWCGDLDDLWQMGPPTGVGGPWKNAVAASGSPSDPYLMAGYNHKILELSHDQNEAVIFRVEVDFAANGAWSEYGRFTVPPREVVKHEFPGGYSAHWVRLAVDRSATVSALFTYT